MSRSNVSMVRPRRSHAVTVLLVVLIADLSVVLSAILPYEGFYRDSPKTDDSGAPNPANRLQDYQAYIPPKWRAVPAEPQPPEIEIHMLKGHIVPGNENLGFSMEYAYASEKYNAPKDEPKKDETQGTGAEQDNEEQQVIEYPAVPQIGSRTVITAPQFCPKGQRSDSRGVCRTILKS